MAVAVPCAGLSSLVRSQARDAQRDARGHWPDDRPPRNRTPGPGRLRGPVARRYAPQVSDESVEAEKIERERLVAFLVRETRKPAVDWEGLELPRLRRHAEAQKKLHEAEHKAVVASVGEVEVIKRVHPPEGPS